MKYLFFDTEKATSQPRIHQICEFGYVITDELFNVLERDNFIINPDLPIKQWDPFVIRNILTRKPYEYELCNTFPYFYSKISALINKADIIVGHTIEEDVKAINNDSLLYDLPSIDYDFYDLKIYYKKYSKSKGSTAVVNILKAFETEGDSNEHDAATDAYNTMLGLKTLLTKIGMTFQELCDWCPEAKDRNENYILESQTRKAALNQKRFEASLTGDGSNDIIKYKKNWKRFLQFLDNVKPNKEGNGTFANEKVSISINYEEHHYKEMLNLIQMIVNEGGTYIMKASQANVFVKFDVLMEDGTLRTDSKLNYVNEAIEEGANIEIIDFDDLLEMLNITETELSEMSIPSFDFLYEEGAIIKDKKDKTAIKRSKKQSNEYKTSQNTTIGDILGDAFKNINLDD